MQDNVAILEAYAKSWTSGSLDKAFARGSLGFSLALHHLHSFIFKFASSDELNLHKKLTKSLLRSHSQKHHNLVSAPSIQFHIGNDSLPKIYFQTSSESHVEFFKSLGCSAGDIFLVRAKSQNDLPTICQRPI